MIPVCSWCGEDITVTNRAFVGFCSPVCREVDRQYRDRDASDRARSRADARQHRDANRRRADYLT